MAGRTKEASPGTTAEMVMGPTGPRRWGRLRGDVDLGGRTVIDGSISTNPVKLDHHAVGGARNGVVAVRVGEAAEGDSVAWGRGVEVLEESAVIFAPLNSP